MTPQPPINLSQARFNMIEQQIRPWDVLDLAVLELLERLPRDAFVPPAHKALAYVDMELPLGTPAVDGECMLAPRVEARMLQDLAVQPTDKVLEVGAGSGYMAALLASRSARSFSGWPAWPLTHCQLILCRAVASTSACHNSAFFTGCFDAVFQPFLRQP